MRVIFSKEFENELKKLGNSIKLSIFRLGKFNINDNKSYLDDNDLTSDYYYFKSIWTKDIKELSISLDLSFIPIDDSILDESADNIRSSIFVYYSDLNNNLLGKAFVLIGDFVDSIPEKLNLCTPNKNNRRDLNHIVVSFPKFTKSNIIVENSVEFLESSSITTGINTILAKEGKYDKSTEKDYYLTKESFNKLVYSDISNLNTIPTFIDKNGNKILNISPYKHYKSINIKPIDILGIDDNYFIENGSKINITGTCTYDLYDIINSSNYRLKKSDCKEDLSVTELVNLDNNNDNDYIINQINKEINFNKLKEVKHFNFSCKISFKSKLTESKDKIINLYSNKITITNYLRWSVEYSSNFYQRDNEGNSHVVLLFDRFANNIGWNPEKEVCNNKITITSDTKVPTNSIYIDSENINIFNKYFEYIVKEPIYDKLNLKYIYTIELSTKLENNSSKWFPLVNDNSILLLNSVKLRNDDGISEKAKFYCVQRGSAKLSLSGYDGNNWKSYDKIILDPSDKFHQINNLYITGSIPNYESWEIEKLGDCNFDLIYSNNQIIDKDSSVSPEKSDSITLLSGAITSKTDKYSEKSLGKFKIKRINSKKSHIDKLDWRDVIYCNEDNNTIIEVVLKSKISEDWIVDFDNIRTKFYSEGIRNSTISRLIILDRYGSNESIRIKYNYRKFGEDPKISTEDDSIFYKFFNISDLIIEYDTNNLDFKILTININSLILLEEEFNLYDWFPKITDSNITRPIKLNITCNKYSETIYCVIKPDLSNTVNFYEKLIDNKLINTNKLIFKNINEEKIKNIYISSSVGELNEFSYWEIIDKDLRINSITKNSKNETNYKIINNNDPNTFIDKDEQKTSIITRTIPTSTLDIDFKPFSIRRLANSYFNKSDNYKDWKNQLSSDIFKLNLKMEGLDSSKNLIIYKLDEFNNFIKIEDEEYLNLDYIGIYKLYVKSNNKFRISIEGQNDLDGFYFFNKLNNTTDKNILSIDEGSFDNIIGKEILFSYLGSEPNNFKSDKQSLETFIKIINLEDNLSTVVKLSRSYNNLDTNISNISVNNSDLKEIFLTENKININYNSNLETVYEGYNIDIINKDINLDYGYYDNINKVVRNGIITTFKSRGYLKNFDNLRIKDYFLYDSNNSYPIKPIGYFNLTNPTNIIDKDEIKVLLYKKYRVPKALINKDEVLLSSNKNSTFEFTITRPNNGRTLIYVKDSTLPDYKEINLYKDHIIQFDKFSIRLTDFGTDEVYLVSETTGKDYTELNKDLDLGNIKIYNYVDKDNFIKDEFDKVIVNKYSQDYVNSIITPESNIIGIKRLCVEKSINSLSPKNNITLIPSSGELKKSFKLSKRSDKDIVDPKKYLTEISDTVSYIGYNDLGNELIVSYFNRLDRNYYFNSYRESGIPIVYFSNYLDNSTLYAISKYSQALIDSNIPIQVGNDKVYTNDIKQDFWKTGIIVNNSLYLGNKSERIIDYKNEYTIKIPWDKDTISIKTSSVKLPKKYYSNSDLNCNFSKGGKPVFRLINGKIYESYNEIINNDHIGFNDYELIFKDWDKNTSGLDKKISEFSLSYLDKGEINEVIIKIVKESRKQFYTVIVDNIEFKETELYKVKSSDIITDLVFSSSGKLSGNYYIVSDVEENLCNVSVNKTEITEILNLPNILDIYPNFNNIITTKYLGSAYFDETRYEIFNIFELNITSTINFFYNYRSEIVIEDYCGHNPFKGRMTLNILGEHDTLNNIDFNTYYGRTNLEIIGPFKSEVSVDSYNYSTRYFTDFKTIDSLESSKYTKLGSKFLSNSYGESYKYLINNTCYIIYSEDIELENRKYYKTGKSDSINLWTDYGYYCGFKLFPKRVEWIKDENGNYVTTKITNFKFKNQSNGNLLFVTDKSENFYWFKDHLCDREMSNHNPDDVEIYKYYDDTTIYNEDRIGYTNGESIVFSNLDKKTEYPPFPAIMLNLHDWEFNEGENNTFNTIVSLDISSEEYNSDPITFYLNIKLIFPKNLQQK